MMALDELNVIKASKTLYTKLEKANEEAFLELARARYEDITGEKAEEEISLEWLLLFLLAYNPVTEFVYMNEVTRKRDRFAESMISGANKLAAIHRAMSLWLRQTEQYLILIEDAAALAGYIANGVERVRWHTVPDERRCPECKSMHGNVYDIDKVPPKPHRFCRCYLIPVEG